MAYDEALATRVRAMVNERIGGGAPAEEKRMFGGLAFLVNTHIAVGVHNGGGLLLSVGPDGQPAAIERGAVPMTMGGKQAPGWVIVPDEVIADEAELAWWVESGVAAALAKQPTPARRQVG